MRLVLAYTIKKIHTTFSISTVATKSRQDSLFIVSKANHRPFAPFIIDAEAGESREALGDFVY